MYTVLTPTLYGYTYAWMKTTDEFFVFRVAACSDVHLALSPEFGVTSGFEIVLGGWQNTKSVIRRADDHGTHLASYQTLNVIHCTDLRWFWVQWDNKHIRVGAGDSINQDRFMDHHVRDEDPQPPYAGIGISTGYTHLGEWEFQDKYGTACVT